MKECEAGRGRMLGYKKFKYKSVMYRQYKTWSNTVEHLYKDTLKMKALKCKPSAQFD